MEYAVLKRQVAVALGYDREKDRAPKVFAKGRGLIARKILELAREYDIPVREDSDLVNVLERLELRQEIPAEAYVAVAEVLAFIYRINSKFQPESPAQSGSFG